MTKVSSREEYSSTYRQLSEDKLERLLAELDELEEDAKVSLILELKARGRTEVEISSLIAMGRNRRSPLVSIEGADAVLTEWVGNVRRIRGTGRAFMGRANCEHNDAYGYDELDTTLWWTILWVPFIPRGSFRIRRKVAYPSLPRLARGNSEFVILRRLPFLWINNMGWLIVAGLLFWYPLVSALVAPLLEHH